MNQITSERRLIENESYFRQHNEQVKKHLDQIEEIAVEENEQWRIQNEGQTVFQFYCECSDENCKQRIALSLDKYTLIHQERHNFIIKPEHQAKEIETVVKKEPTYWIVKKIIAVPEKVGHLNATNINNT